MIIATTASVFAQSKIALNGAAYKVSKDNVSWVYSKPFRCYRSAFQYFVYLRQNVNPSRIREGGYPP